jgi:hypothetical protein
VDPFIYPFLFNFEYLLSLGAVTLKECQNLWVLGSTSELVNLTILAKQNLPKKKSRSKKSEERHKYLMGALDSAHFSLQEKSDYLVWMPLGNYADIKKKKKKTLSYIKAIE